MKFVFLALIVVTFCTLTSGTHIFCIFHIYPYTSNIYSWYHNACLILIKSIHIYEISWGPSYIFEQQRRNGETTYSQYNMRIKFTDQKIFFQTFSSPAQTKKPKKVKEAAPQAVVDKKEGNKKTSPVAAAAPKEGGKKKQRRFYILASAVRYIIPSCCFCWLCIVSVVTLLL